MQRNVIGVKICWHTDIGQRIRFAASHVTSRALFNRSIVRPRRITSHGILLRAMTRRYTSRYPTAPHGIRANRTKIQTLTTIN